MKIYIMHVISSFNIGGLETVVANLINSMDNEKFSHSICVFSDQLTALKKINNKKIKTFIIKRNFGNDPSVIFRLARLLKKETPDIVRTYNWGGIEGVISARLSGIKCIIHSEHGSGIEEIRKGKRRRIVARRMILKLCSRIIAVSRMLQKWLIEVVKIKEEKIIYIPNGCDINKFHPGKDSEKREILGLREDDVVVGCVGSLKELKDQETLIKGFGKIAKSYDNLKLMLVGSGPQEKYLISLAEKMDLKERIIFTGGVPEADSFYRMMNIFVLSSLSENCPNVLIEAMATGLPIIATDIGDVRYILGGEKGGIIIGTKDVDALADGIRFFLKNPYLAKEKGEFVRKRAESLFNLDSMVKRFESLYLTMLNVNN